MAPIECDRRVTIFQQLHAIEDVHRYHACRIFGADGIRSGIAHHNMHIVIVVVAKRLGQHAALCFFDFAKKIIWIRRSIYSLIHFLVAAVLNGQGVVPNGLFKFIRQGRVALPESLGWSILRRVNNRWIGRKVIEIEMIQWRTKEIWKKEKIW